MSKENIFCSSNAPEIHIFNSLRYQKLLLVANQLQDGTFLFDINNEGIVISKLVSQLKLLPSLFEPKDNDINNEDNVSSKLVPQLKLLPNLFEPKDNDTIVMSTINKKYRCDEIEAS